MYILKMTSIQTDLKDHLRPLIPILKVGKVDRSYALRLTPQGKYGIDEIEVFMKLFDDYVYVNELSKKDVSHFHFCLFTKMDEEDVRVQIREFLKKYFPDAQKRGDANKQYNLKITDNLESVLIYLCKDGGTIVSSPNIDLDYMSELKKKSYKKFTKEDFAKSLELLKIKFKDEDPSLGDMMEDIVKLKALYRQPINMMYIYQMCISYKVHNAPNRSTQLVQNFLSRV